MLLLRCSALPLALAAGWQHPRQHIGSTIAERC
jgi:hypothetical protein